MAERTVEGGNFIVDARGTLLGFDGRMEALTGWSAAQVVGREKAFGNGFLNRDDAGGRGAPRFDPDEIRRRNGVLPLELRLRCADGRVLDVEASAFRVAGSGDRVTIAVHRVLAETPANGSASDAGFDPATGLAAREAFLASVRAAVADARRTGRPLAMIVADVDHLRKVGDRFGGGAEATVLRKVAGILRATVGNRDLVARIGEDDFALLLPGLGRGSARQVAARLRSTVERFRFLGPSAGAGPRVTLSLGAATFPADADDADDLLARALDALDEARSLGRNRVWCYTRRPRVPLRTPVYLDGSEPLLLGYSKDLSPSGLFVSTPAPIDIGMRCAFSFPLPKSEGHVHVIGRVVRAVPLQDAALGRDLQVPGMGIEFERFGPEDRRSIEAFLFENEGRTLRPEGIRFSIPTVATTLLDSSV